MTDTQHIDALARTCSKVLAQMTSGRVGELQVRLDEKTSPVLAYGQVVEFGIHGAATTQGLFLVGFSEEADAVAVASAIASNMGLGSLTTLSSDARDVLQELMNTITGRVIAEWERGGASCRFGAPRSESNLSLGELGLPQASIGQMALTLGEREIVVTSAVGEKPAGEFEGKRVLVVDDSTIVLKIVVTALGKLGFEIETAGDGKEGVEKYRSFGPDLTITDLVMPEMGGLEAIIEIRESDPEARVIVLTSMTRTDERVTAATLGVRHYLVKPFNPEELVKVVREALAD